jgi:hypothetical protein
LDHEDLEIDVDDWVFTGNLKTEILQLSKTQYGRQSKKNSTTVVLRDMDKDIYIPTSVVSSI